MTYLLGFGWGIVLLTSFAGWGLALRRRLTPNWDENPPDWGRAIVLGMSLIIALGGFLNNLKVMTWSVVLLLALGGLFLFILVAWQLRSQKGWKGAIGWPRTRFDILVLIVCLLAYSACVCLCFSPYDDPSLRQRFTINPWDDLKGGYITLPLRLLGEGNLGDDPFNDKRSLALGGLSLLQAFPLLFLPATYIHLLDPGLAILTLPLLLHSLGRRRAWPPWLVSVLTLFCLVLRSPRVSSSASLLPTLFLLTMYGMLEDLAVQPRVRLAEVGRLALVAMAVMTLKNTLVPGTCLILGIYAVLDWTVRRDLRRSVVSGASAGVILLVLLGPWLISSFRASGTALYPLLGQGYRTNPMVDLPKPARLRGLAMEGREFVQFVKDPRILLFFLLGALGLAAPSRPARMDARGIAYLAALLSSFLVLILFFRTFPADWLRYSYNFLTLVLLTSFALLLRAEEERTGLRGLLAGGPKWIRGLLILLTIAGCIYQTQYIAPSIKMILASVTRKGWDPNREAPTYRRLQRSIPRGQRLMAFLPMAHLLDFGRNPINVMDSTCAISPPPGMPLRRGPATVAAYLRGHGISWIATEETSWYPGGRTGNPEVFRQWSEKNADQWSRSTIYSYYLMTRCLKDLGAMYETTRFDHDLVLINLDRPRGNHAPTSLAPRFRPADPHESTWHDLHETEMALHELVRTHG